MWAYGPPKTLTESDLKSSKYRSNSSKLNSLQTLCYFSSTGNQCRRKTRKYNMTMQFFFIRLCLVFSEVFVFFDSHYQVSVTDNTRQDNISLLYFFLLT